ncbi:hypothetical protein Cni_G13925 [Canna indica]|uniref:Dilute domain-containing protein n=1 Tax=Canna indica TaxID=4628 RepID=A0AAQ3KDI8_9LILI|nr:hypothetical protein Cni_G13925 [Canna indica]
MAARETGALKEAKDKLEKKVEELTWRLELVEKRMRKLKGRKLQSYKVKLDEAHEAMTKEIEGARIAIEQAPPITKEVLVEENSMLELLTTRNKELEVKENIEFLLETNLSILESENKVLRQQTLLGSTNEDLSEHKITTLESDNDLLRNQQKTDCQPIDSSEVIKPPSENELVHDQQAIVHQPSVTFELTEPIIAKENHEALIKCLKEYKSFDNKRPTTTLIVYKSLFHWHSFEAERTNIFERIIQTIRSSVENQENIGELAYWLSTTSTLLFLLQKNLRESNASSTGSYRSRATTSSFFSRIAQNARSSSSIMGISSGYSGMLGKPGSQSRIEASLLLRWEFCSFSNAEFVKDGLQDLEKWCSKTIEQLVGTAWEQLQHIRHAVEFLVLHQKSQKTLEEIRNEIYPNDIEDGVTCHQNAIT